jgi:hypothetical protein
MMLKDFGLRSSRSSRNGDAGIRSDRSSDSSVSKKPHSRFKGESVAERLKEMNPHYMLVMLELYAVTDNAVAFEAFQSLKNSEPRLSSIKGKQQNRRV